MTDPLVLLGRLVTFDGDRPVIPDGALYIGGDDLIHAAQEAGAPPPAGFDGARRVKTGGAIYPGLIDLHGHMVYNALSLWSPQDHPAPYTTRYQWPGDKNYKPQIGDPANALGLLAGKALLKYVEVKAVIGGTTAVQGSAKMSHPYEGWLVRNVEFETFTTGKKSVFQSALPLRDDAAYATERQHMLDGNAFIYHLAEGTDHAALVGEYDKMRTTQCLLPRLGAIHCTALDNGNFSEWGPKGGSVIWSPFSNLWLYRDTTRVDEARDAGLNVCLGADWSPSGSKNVLGELKVADMWNRDHLGLAFSDRALCEMVTCNPADALGWGDKLGRLKEGLHGDVLVTSDRGGDAYRNLIESLEDDVRFVAINGQPFYGATKLMQAAGATTAEAIKVGRYQRQIVLVYPGVPDADIGWQEVLTELDDAIQKPQAKHAANLRLAARGAPLYRLLPDKPWDQLALEAVPIDAKIPPLDSLTHDAAYFRAVARSPIHGGLLNSVRDYYPGGSRWHTTTTPVPSASPSRR
ncbi:MAG: amidohydrolase family protein [Thermoleophilaceae bacterium]